MYQSTKTFDNYSVALRQWKAQHSHCQLLHGYSFRIKIWFAAESLNDLNWVVDFGGFKSAPLGNGLKDWLDSMFDHTTLIEHDDPFRDIFEQLAQMGICKVHFLERMGCESLAELIFNKFNEVLSKTDAARSRVIKVEIHENERNSAIFESI
jgi:6-pyruvoyltetrahydropterin/6-carboxytetrahydropterin synthase